MQHISIEQICQLGVFRIECDLFSMETQFDTFDIQLDGNKEVAVVECFANSCSFVTLLATRKRSLFLYDPLLYVVFVSRVVVGRCAYLAQ